MIHNSSLVARFVAHSDAASSKIHTSNTSGTPTAAYSQSYFGHAESAGHTAVYAAFSSPDAEARKFEALIDQLKKEHAWLLSELAKR